MKSIHINAEIVTMKNGSNMVKKLMHTNIAFDSDTTFESLLEFQSEARRLFQQVVRAAKAGKTYEYTVTMLKYKNGTMDLEDTEVWYANSYDGLDNVGTDDNGKEYIHLNPDIPTTASHWDMCMYADVMRSLAEAHI